MSVDEIIGINLVTHEMVCIERASMSCMRRTRIREGQIMDDLIQQLQAKAGLSPDQAQKAAGVVAGFLESNVDAEQLQAIAGKIPGLGAHADKIPDNIGDTLADRARGLFGKKD